MGVTGELLRGNPFQRPQPRLLRKLTGSKNQGRKTCGKEVPATFFMTNGNPKGPSAKMFASLFPRPPGTLIENTLGDQRGKRENNKRCACHAFLQAPLPQFTRVIASAARITKLPTRGPPLSPASNLLSPLPSFSSIYPQNHLKDQCVGLLPYSP